MSQLSTIESELQSINPGTNSENTQELSNSNNHNVPNNQAESTSSDNFNGGDTVYELDADFNGDFAETSTSPENLDEISDNFGQALKHIHRHFLQNNHVVWVVLGIAIFVAAISCPCWVACCLGCHFYRNHKSEEEEKPTYFATSDSDEEKTEKNPTGNSLVRKLTTISKQRRRKELRKGTYEPLNSLEDD